MWNKCRHRYHNSGITVCPRWESFEAFYHDMGDKWVGTRLQRIDRTADFGPDNCIWIQWPSKRSRRRERAPAVSADVTDGRGTSLKRVSRKPKPWHTGKWAPR
jgi:hypothetical protein